MYGRHVKSIIQDMLREISMRWWSGSPDQFSLLYAYDSNNIVITCKRCGKTVSLKATDIEDADDLYATILQSLKGHEHLPAPETQYIPPSAVRCKKCRHEMWDCRCIQQKPIYGKSIADSVVPLKTKRAIELED